MKHTFYIEPKDAKKTIKEFLKMQEISSKALKKIKMQGKILVNTKEQTVRYVLQSKDILELQYPKETANMIHSKMSLDIRYEDDCFLVVNKPSGIPCIPNKRYPNNTLANGLLYYYDSISLDATIHLVNRLDKETRGLLLVAKNRYYHAMMANSKQMQRVYHCLVEGQMFGQGVINQPILKMETSIKRIIDGNGKVSITNYRVLQTFEEQTLVECILETGRTHQIRVHMASLGHPLVGDTLYGSMHQGPYYLESIYLGFTHPLTKAYIEVRI